MSGEWRNYSDEQWMRLSGATGEPPAASRVCGFSSVPLALVTPLAILAGFLAIPARSDVPASRQTYLMREERSMNQMAVGIAALTASTSVAFGQNLLQNGGLEGGSPTSCSGFVTLGGGSTDIAGWTVAGPWSVDWNWTIPGGPCCDSTPEGNRTVDLNGSPAQDGGAIRQTIPTVAGRRYRVSVLALANGCCTPIGTAKTMRITTGSITSDHTLLTQWGSSDTVGVECDWSRWTRIEREWVADAASTAIEFRSLVLNSAGGILIDDISVTEVGPRDLLVPSQYPTIAAAIAASHANDRVLVSPGTYAWTSATIAHSLTIQGTGGAMSTRFVGNGNEASPLLDCVPGAGGTVIIRNLFVANGRGIHATNGTITLERCMFAANTTGLMIEGDANFAGATVTNCAFVSNGGPGTEQAGGVGMYSAVSDGPGADLSNCMFIDNQAQEGGGFHVSHSASSATNCLFARNRATTYSGGAIARWWGHLPIPLTNCGFTSNSAAWGGTDNWNCCVSCNNCNFAPATDTTTDCNGNFIADSAEILVDASVDSNQNGILDSCEPAPCHGDVDQSGSVNGIDLAVVLQNWGVPSPKYPRSDVNGDGVVNASDLALVLSNWGTCP